MPYIDRDAIPYFFTEDGTRLIAFKDYVDKVPDADVVPTKEVIELLNEITVSLLKRLNDDSAIDESLNLMRGAKKRWNNSCGRR